MGNGRHFGEKTKLAQWRCAIVRGHWGTIRGGDGVRRCPGCGAPTYRWRNRSRALVIGLVVLHVLTHEIPMLVALGWWLLSS